MQPANKEKVSVLEGIKRSYRNMAAELKKVNWPSRQELITYTIVVIFTVFAVSAIITVWDILLAQLFKVLGFYR